LILFIDNIENEWKDDSAMAVPLQIQGAYFGKSAVNGYLAGNFNLYRVSAGSNFGDAWNGSFYESDTWGQPGITTRAVNSAAPSNTSDIFKSFMMMTNSPNPHYRFPIQFSGNVTLKLIFFDSWSNASRQRLFQVFVNNVSIQDSPIDIFNISGGMNRVVVLQRTIPFNSSNSNSSSMELQIRFQNIVGSSILSAIEVVQDMNITLSDYNKMNDIPINYAAALHMSFLFFDQLRAGRFTNRRIAWRNTSCYECYGPGGRDLTGGYHEAGGNYLKLNFPMAWSLANVGLGLVEHKSGFNRSKQIPYALDTLKHGYDYVMNSRLDANRIVLSMGDRRLDFPYGGPPEFYSKLVSSRPIWIMDANASGKSSETCGEVAACLAIGSMIYKDIDNTYSEKLTFEAVQYYNFGKRFESSYMSFSNLNNGYNDMASLYRSASFLDEMAWGAAMLYRATGNETFLDDARSYYMRYQRAMNNGCGFAYSWDEKGPLLHVMMGHIDKNETNRQYYDARAKEYFDRYLPGKFRTVPHTPKGLAYPIVWGSSRYAANTAYIAILHSKYLRQRNSSTPVSYQNSLYNYGKFQIDYILGKTGSSMMVGMGVRQPESILHKSSYYSYLTHPKYYKFIAYGSISGNPIQINGKPSDILLHPGANIGQYYMYNEPGLDFAGPSTAAIAALAEDYDVTPISDNHLDLGWSYKV
jgi:hypothetical protein